MARTLIVAPWAIAGVLGIAGTLAFSRHAPLSNSRVSFAARAPSAAAPLAAPHPPATAAADTRAAGVSGPVKRPPPLRFTNTNTRQSLDVTLYDESGHLDEREAARLDAALGDTRDPKAPATTVLDRRTLQLVERAALHFGAEDVEVISAYRKPGRRREGPHASGKAIDFKLPGVASRTLAAYLRTMPRVGVGIYTHPRTAYVHLDTREHSFHWLDASPPGRTYREMSIGGSALARRDAAYVRADDWPEGMAPPADATR